MIQTLGLLMLLAIIFSTIAIGTPEYAKKEDKACLFCHTAVGKPDLNDAGKYYKENGYSLKGYKEKKGRTPELP